MTAPFAAYFSMELALDSAMPTNAGGLGILAGDTVRGAAHLGVPLVAVTLLHREGYFRQHLDAHNGSFFNAQRTYWETVDNAYLAASGGFARRTQRDA